MCVCVCVIRFVFEHLFFSFFPSLEQITWQEFPSTFLGRGAVGLGRKESTEAAENVKYRSIAGVKPHRVG